MNRGFGPAALAATLVMVLGCGGGHAARDAGADGPAPVRCNPLAATPCPDGLACLVALGMGEGFFWCVPPPTGMVPEGEPCGSGANGNCAPGLVCILNDVCGTVCARLCSPADPAAAGCGTSPCTGDGTYVDDTGATLGSCVVVSPNLPEGRQCGGTCSCADGLACLYDATLCGRHLQCCVKAGAEGQPCLSDDSCNAGLVCANVNSCPGLPAPGFHYDCCLAPGGERQPCRPDRSCDDGLFCASSATCPESLAECCVAPAPCDTLGASCTAYADFYCAAPAAGTCPSGDTCCLPFPGGADRPCDAYDRCLSGMVCAPATAVTCPFGLASCCQPAGAAAEACDSAGRCDAGLACVTQPAGVCPYGRDACCAAADPCGAHDSCGTGFACVAAGAACPAGQTKCCLPVGGLHEACGAGGLCAGGHGCLAGDVGTATWCENLDDCCLPAGALGEPCSPGTPPTCDAPLACVAAASGACSEYPGAASCCTTAGGLNQPCYADDTCDGSYSCVADLACPTWLTKCCR